MIFPENNGNGSICIQQVPMFVAGERYREGMQLVVVDLSPMDCRSVFRPIRCLPTASCIINWSLTTILGWNFHRVGVCRRHKKSRGKPSSEIRHAMQTEHATSASCCFATQPVQAVPPSVLTSEGQFCRNPLSHNLFVIRSEGKLFQYHF